MSNSPNKVEIEIQKINKSLNEYGVKLAKLIREYSDILSNIDDDNLSATLLNQKSKFQKLYDSFDVSDNGFTFRGDIKTNSKNERIGMSLIDNQIKIYGDNDGYEDIFFGISESLPVLTLGSGVQNPDGSGSGQLTIEKHNTDNGTFVIFIYTTRNGEQNSIIIDDNGISLNAGRIVFDCDTVSFECANNIVGLPEPEPEPEPETDTNGGTGLEA